MAKAVSFKRASREEARRFAEVVTFVSAGSDDFLDTAVAAVESAVAHFPVGVLRILAAQRVTIGVLQHDEGYAQFSPSIAEAFEDRPDLSAELDESCAGMYVIPEATLLVHEVNDGVFTHELGHALDAALAREAKITEMYLSESAFGPGTIAESYILDKPVSNYATTKVQEHFAETFRGIVGANLAGFPQITAESVAEGSPIAAAFFQKTFARLEFGYPEVALAPRHTYEMPFGRLDDPQSELRRRLSSLASAIPSGKRDLRQEITDKVITQLEQGTIPWEKPWEFVRPLNGATEKAYKGINTLHLMMTARERGYDDPRWMTFKQAQGLGFQVRRGEKGTSIEYWKPPDIGREYELHRQRHPEYTKSLEDFTRESAGRLRWTPFYSAVFNAAQVDAPVLDRDGKELIDPGGDGVDGRVMRPLSEARPHTSRNREPFVVIEAAQAVLKSSNAKIFNDGGDRAYYQSNSDTIHLPRPELFKTIAGYYSTALHELGHWTGHPSRLDREYFKNPDGFGSPQYAKEELRAELASVFLSAETGLEYNVQNHSSYIGGWLQALRQDKNELMRAAGDAERITDYVQAFSLEHAREQSVEESRALADDAGISLLAPGARLDDVRRTMVDVVRGMLQTGVPIVELVRAVDREMVAAGAVYPLRMDVMQSLRLVPRELVTMAAARAATGDGADLTDLVLRAIPVDARSGLGWPEPREAPRAAMSVEHVRTRLEAAFSDVVMYLDPASLLSKATIAQRDLADSALATLPHDLVVKVQQEPNGGFGFMGLVEAALSGVSAETYVGLRDAATHHAIVEEIREAGQPGRAYRAEDDALKIAVDVKACFSPGMEGSTSASSDDWNKAAYLYRNNLGSESLDCIVIASLKASPHMNFSEEKLRNTLKHDVSRSLGDIFAATYADEVATSLIARSADVREGAATQGLRSAAEIIDAALNHPPSMAHPSPRLSGLSGESAGRLHGLVERMLESSAPVSRAALAVEIRSQLGILPLASTSPGAETLRSPEFRNTMESLGSTPEAVLVPSRQAALILTIDESLEMARDPRLSIASIVAVPPFEGRGHEAKVLDAVCSYADVQNMEIVVRAGAHAEKHHDLLVAHGFASKDDGTLVRMKREPQALALRAERSGEVFAELQRREAIAAGAVAILDASDHARVQAAIVGKEFGESRAPELTL